MHRSLYEPAYMSSEAASLLRGLLQREPPKRLGYGPKGSEDIMAHAFFRPLNWGRLLRREMASPFRPSVNHADRCGCFPTWHWMDRLCLPDLCVTCLVLNHNDVTV